MSMASPGAGPDTSRMRLGILGIVVVSLFAAMFARLWFLQVMDSKTLAGKVFHNATRVVYEPAPRGRILDRQGRVMVDNRYSYVVTLSRQAAAKDPPVMDRLATLFTTTRADLQKKVDDPRYSPYRPVPLFEDVPIDKIVFIREHTEDFPPEEVGADRQAERTYPAARPDGSVPAAHVLGYVGEINDDELKSLKTKGYAQGDEVGKTGVEQSYEQYLRGKAGRTVLEVDARGNVLRTLEHEDPVQGNDVQLTIDLDAQRNAEDSLALGIDAAHKARDKETGKGFVAPAGAATVLDPRDGSVLAMASLPAYNPADFINGISPAKFAAYQDPANHFPLNNRAIDGQYAPGSTFKLVTSTAALSRGLINANTSYNDTGSFKLGNQTYSNAGHQSYGYVAAPRAITVSSDAFFYNLGAQFWQQRSRFGPTPIQDTARAYGFAAKTGFPLGGEAAGRVSDPDQRKKLHDKYPKAFPEGNWYGGDNVLLDIGEGEPVVTPVQLANAYDTLGNGGTVWQPKVAARVLDRTGKVVVEFQPKQNGHVDLPSSVRDPILSRLKGVTADKKGTGYLAFNGFTAFPVAAKTGTAQVTGKEDTAVFAAFGPADSPQYAVSIFIEEAGFGGEVAAPVARRIFDGLAGKPLGPVTFGGAQD